MNKFQAQINEIAQMLRSSGLTKEQLADRAGLKLTSFMRYARGNQEASKLVMNTLRLVAGPGSEVIKTGLRYVPVVSWACAGAAVDYEEMQGDWTKKVPTDCPDMNAFGVEIKGDSMEQKYSEGETAVLMPGTHSRNGDLVVANLKKQGAVFKLLHVVDGKRLRLTSYNPAYPALEFFEKDFHWIYPVHSVVRHIYTL